MTKKSIVVKADFRKSYTGKFGEIFIHDIKFSNGDEGEYHSKFKEQNNFILDNEAIYEIENRKDAMGNVYNKISPSKDNTLTPSKPETTNKKYVDNSIGMMVGAAINNACLLHAHGKIGIEQIQDTATLLCDISIRLKEKYS